MKKVADGDTCLTELVAVADNPSYDTIPITKPLIWGLKGLNNSDFSTSIGRSIDCPEIDIKKEQGVKPIRAVVPKPPPMWVYVPIPADNIVAYKVTGSTDKSDYTDTTPVIQGQAFVRAYVNCVIHWYMADGNYFGFTRT